MPINADADIGFAEHTDSDPNLEERADEQVRVSVHAKLRAGVTPKTDADTNTNTEHG